MTVRTFFRGIAMLAALAVAGAALVWWLNIRGEAPLEPAGAPANAAADATLVTRGAYLARAGNCLACHTARGGAPGAGGRPMATPFGTLYTSNITPHPQNGIGQWTASAFWRAMHHGRSRDGRLLYPAFPYTSYTHVTRNDSDAIHAYLRTLPPADSAPAPHALRWPYSTQAALAVWRALYFRAGGSEPEARPGNEARTAEWQRGAYLVRGLGHCAGCHTARNALGATDDALDLAGGMIPQQNWYAPSLTRTDEAGVADWPVPDIVALLKTGSTPRGSVLGPMAEVVQHSTQHMTDADLAAMAVYLKALPATDPPVPRETPPASAQVAQRGGKLYGQHCAQCHGDNGEGVPNAYPRLAGNRAVTMDATANLVQTVLYGGFAPATTGNPQPFGMPPYVLTLSDADTAAVLTHIRTAFGNQAAPVSQLDVQRQRESLRP